MTRRRKDVNKLLVEGKQDCFSIVYLLDHYIVWGDKPNECVEAISDYDGVDDLLGPDEIETVLLSPGLEAVGIVVDANGDIERRWNEVRRHCVATFPALPVVLPPEGLIATNAAGLRLGVWIMPDNQSGGMLESLLVRLIPPEQVPLLDYAKEVVATAVSRGAPVKVPHLPKAEVHTWLAWQDPPDLQLHQAIVARVLQPGSEATKPFVEWFIRLFLLDDLRRPTPI